MKDIDLYKTYYYNYNGNIVTAKIISQTDKSIFVQLSNEKRIKISYDELYDHKEDIDKKNLQRAKLEKMYEGYVEPTFM